MMLCATVAAITVITATTVLTADKIKRTSDINAVRIVFIYHFRILLSFVNLVKISLCY